MNGSGPRGRIAVVLPGGGARGAYEIGAMSVLLPALERHGERVTVWCGTSVGAINAAMFGSLADLPIQAQVDEAMAHWREMRKHHVIAPITGRGGARALLRLIGHALGVRGIGLASLLDPSPLQASLEKWIDWRRLRGNVKRGDLDAVCVVATSLRTGEPVGFVSTRHELPPTGTMVSGTSPRGSRESTFAHPPRSRCCSPPWRCPRRGWRAGTTSMAEPG